MRSFIPLHIGLLGVLLGTPFMGCEPDTVLFGHTYNWYLTPDDLYPAPGTKVMATNAQGKTFGPAISDPDAYYELRLPPGTYTVNAEWMGYTHTEECVVVEDGEATELDLLIYLDVVEAPYIYLYPEIAQMVGVTLTPAPGTVVHSAYPPYEGGWTVWAEPSGLLDGTYPYLYYEATVLWVFQTEEGWAVDGEEILEWFEDILPGLGLTEDEVDDFLDFWSIHLPFASCYHVFPQSEAVIEETMGLSIVPEPDSLLRLWLVIQGAATCIPPAEPEVFPFEREGFTVVEWGVVLDAETF